MLYQRIAIALKEKIITNVYCENTRLPSEVELAKLYETTKMTIRKSLHLLVKSGLITNIPNSGYFVNNHAFIHSFTNLSAHSLYDIHPKTSIYNQFVSFKLINITVEIALKLNLPNDAKIYEAIRIRYIKEEPTIIEIIYLPYSMLPNLTNKHLGGSIYKYIQLQGFNIGKYIKTLHATTIPLKFLGYMPFNNNKPIILSENIGVLVNGTPILLSLTYHINDSFTFISDAKDFINYDVYLKEENDV